MKALFILIGIATIYAGPYVGQPLYCDTDGTLLYTVPSKSAPSPAQRGRVGVGAGAWVALDVRLYRSGQVHCGDHVVLFFPPAKRGGHEGGPTLHARALDGGPFAGYYVADYPDLPIVADVPVHFWPVHEGPTGPRLSSTVILLNLSALDRAMDAAHAHLEEYSPPILPGD
jgi:hypothetical protein